MDYTELLRRLALDDGGLAEDLMNSASDDFDVDAKTLALARLGALIAVGGAEPSFGSQIDAAVSAGAKAREIVDILVGVAAIVGAPRVVDAAPKIANAFGYDLYDEDPGRVAGAASS